MNDSVLPAVIDGHNDVLTKLWFKQDERSSFFEESEVGHIDLPRSKAGGFGGGFFAIMPQDSTPFAEPKRVGAGESWEVDPFPAIDARLALEQSLAISSFLFRLESQSSGGLRVVTSVRDLKESLSGSVLAAILHFEGAEAIDSDLHSLEVFYRAGLRSLGLVWSRPNAYAHGVPFIFPHSPDTGPGLTDAGERLVAACNQLGIMVDLAHLNEKGFWDVASISRDPLVASHSNAHALCPITRNLTDKQLDAIAESGGLVGVNFSVAMLREDGRNEPETPIAEIVRHIVYIADRIGIDHVAIGSDFDGTTIPAEIKDVTGLPKLLLALQEKGFDDDSLRRVANENWIRVLAATWKN